MLSPAAIRRTIYDLIHGAQASHLGCCLSAVEMLAAVYSHVDVAKIRDRRPDRDIVIVSKGHCAAAVYATLHHAGILPEPMLRGYCKSGSKLTGLVAHGVAGVEHSTGSLGHGLGVAVGSALAIKRKWLNRSSPVPTVYCLVGDAELQEGSNYEAMMLAVQNGLDNLVLLVDDNRLGMIRRTDEVCSVDAAARIRAFGWKVWEMDGHSQSTIAITLKMPRTKPTALICRTVKGKGFSKAEDKPEWHYRPLSDADHALAVAELAV